MRHGARAPTCALAAALLLACAALAVPAAAQLPKLPAPVAKPAESAAKPAESKSGPADSKTGPAETGAKPAEPEPDAAPAASAPATPAELHAKLAEQRAELAREIEDVKARQSAAVGDEAIALGSERTLLETLDGGLSQLDLVVRMSESLAESEAKAPPPPALAGLGAAPYGLTDLDALQDALDADAEKRARRAAAAEVVKSELESANADLQRLEEARRLAREALGAAAPGAELAARRRLRLAELESRRGEVRRDIVARTLENAKREGALLDRDEGLLREGLARVRGDLELRPEELESALADVDAREGKLERELERAKADLAERQSRLGRAQATLDATPPPAASLAAEVAARRTETRIGGLRTTLLEDQLGRTKAERELWRDRYRVLSDELGRSELRELDKKLLRVRDGLESARRIWETGREEVRSDAREARERATKASRRAERDGDLARARGPELRGRRRGHRRPPRGPPPEPAAPRPGARRPRGAPRGEGPLRALRERRRGRGRGLGPRAHLGRRPAHHGREGRRRALADRARLPRGELSVADHRAGRAAPEQGGRGRRQGDREPRLLRPRHALLPVLARLREHPAHRVHAPRRRARGGDRLRQPGADGELHQRSHPPDRAPDPGRRRDRDRRHPGQRRPDRTAEHADPHLRRRPPDRPEQRVPREERRQLDDLEQRRAGDGAAGGRLRLRHARRDEDPPAGDGRSRADPRGPRAPRPAPGLRRERARLPRHLLRAHARRDAARAHRERRPLPDRQALPRGGHRHGVPAARRPPRRDPRARRAARERGRDRAGGQRARGGSQGRRPGGGGAPAAAGRSPGTTRGEIEGDDVGP